MPDSEQLELDLGDDWSPAVEEEWALYIRQREDMHGRVGMPMWSYEPIGRHVDDVTVADGLL